MSDKDRAFAKALGAITKGAEAAKSLPKIDAGHTAVETSPGHITITCNHSGQPLVRTNDYGTFCDASPCACEEQSKTIAAAMGDFFPGVFDDDSED